MLSAEAFVDPSERGGPCELGQQLETITVCKNCVKNVFMLMFLHLDSLFVATTSHPMLHLGT